MNKNKNNMDKKKARNQLDIKLNTNINTSPIATDSGLDPL